MFTVQTSRILDQAKREAQIRGLEELPVEVLLSIVQQGEGRILMAHCTGVSTDLQKENFQTIEDHGKLFDDLMVFSKETHSVLIQAKKLAGKVPDRSHPGYIALRHLVCALAMAPAACKLLQVKPIAEQDALNNLTNWYNNDDDSPALGELSNRLRQLRVNLLEHVFGQDHAVQAFIEGLFTAELLTKADNERKRPQAIFVFAGPPGVGKTYLAELGAEKLKRPFKRFDMSAYSDHQQYMELVGWPPSYQAAKKGLLTGYVKDNPDAFLLFDEIEKANLTTINLFLQILDAGRLEDKYSGDLVTFKDTIIIFTTNAGASLYDRPNESGFISANSSFHRQTILDALHTEKGPNDQPVFPQAICSRLSTGYPVLFNHLKINELERIAQKEIGRVSNLIEHQYYKRVTYDAFLPLALVLKEGSTADARTIRAQSGAFMQSELYKLTELYNPRRLEYAWREMDTLHFGFDTSDQNDLQMINLFTSAQKPKILLVSSKDLAELYQANIPEIEWFAAENTQEAVQILARHEVDLALLDLFMGVQLTNDSLKSSSMKSLDYMPYENDVLTGGLELLRCIHERLPNTPVLLLSLEKSGEQSGAIDTNLLRACILNGGAREICPTAFVNASNEDWNSCRQQFVDHLFTVFMQIYHEKKALSLGQERKVLNFDTVPVVTRKERKITIQMNNLRLTRMIASGDVGEMIENVERPAVRFGDVFGAEYAKEALQFIVNWLRDPRRYAALGVRPPKGILLTGDPGTGKTMLARAVAGESDVAFLVASGTDFVTVWQGSGPQNIRDLFSRARRYAPSIVFIDEIDAIGKKRAAGGEASRAEESTLNALLTEMDGFGSPTLKPVIVLAATNLVDHLDEALRRRFDREIEVHPPDRQARLAFLHHELINQPFTQIREETLESLATRSAGLTIANLRRIINEAAVMAAQNESQITDAILEEAFEKLQVGETGSKPDMDTLTRIARHEAGHALIGWLAGKSPVQVTIIGRGSAGGYVEREIQEEKMIYTKTELELMISQTLGGRAAELLYYGEIDGLSTGASNDLHQATSVAGRMVREFGMSQEFGPISFSNEQYPGNSVMAQQITTQVSLILKAQLLDASRKLQANQDKLDILSSSLLEKNRLTRVEFEKLLA